MTNQTRVKWYSLVFALYLAQAYLPNIIFGNYHDPWGCGGCFHPTCGLPSPPPWVAFLILVIFIGLFIMFAIADDQSKKEQQKKWEEAVAERNKKEAERIEAERVAAEERVKQIEDWTKQYGWFVGKTVYFYLDTGLTSGVVMSQEADDLTINYLTRTGQLGNLVRKINTLAKSQFER